MTSLARELYRSSNLVVRALSGRNSRICVTTFDSYADIIKLPREAFAENFLAQLGIDAVHVQSSDNDWYQYAELPEALAAIKQATSGYERVLTYGSSMGGFAAIRFGGAIGAHTAIAISPQYSINPAIVPWENRWAHERERIRFVLDDIGYAAWAPHAVVFYDPTIQDRLHTDLLAQHTNVERMGLRYSGHPSSSFLAETHLLRPAIEDILHERFDRAAFVAACNAARRQSPHYLMQLSEHGRSADRAIRLAQQALDISGGDASYLSHLGTILTRHGRHHEALSAHRSALAAAPNVPVFVFRYSEALEAAGDLAAAADIIDEIIRTSNVPHIFRARASYLRQTQNAVAATSPEPAPPRPSVAANVVAAASQLPRTVLGAARHRWALFSRRPQRVSEPPALLADDDHVSTPGEPPLLDVAALPLDQRVTQTPAPPTLRHAWQRHLDILATLDAASRTPVDLALLGDSHVQYWPEDLFRPWTTLNAGVIADKTQQTLWRLRRMMAQPIKARAVLIVLGTNHLGDDDTPLGISEGIAAVATQARAWAPGALVAVLELLPCGPQFAFRADDRQRANALLRAQQNLVTISAEDVLTADDLAYQPDNIHLSPEGYRRLTARVRERLSARLG